MTPQESKEFTEIYSDLNKRILAVLSKAKTMNDAKEALGMLENLAGYDLPQAKTMYGLALLMQDKPWYDSKKGLLWLKKGADEADGNEHDASFSMFQYGIILVDGQLGVPADPITGKYWIDKAAAAGYEPAKKEQDKRWNR
jgi:TPR repeat protein